MIPFAAALVAVLAATLAPSATVPDGGCVFAWPSGPVKVTEQVTKNGQSALQTYVITLRSGGGSRAVHYTEFEFLEYGGSPMTPELQEALKGATAMASVIPHVLVDARGIAVGVVGIEGMIQRLKGFMAESGASSDEIEQIATMMAAPEMTAVLREVVMSVWSNWVGDWVGFDGRVGETTASELPLDPSKPNGPKVQIRRTNRGESPDHPGMASFGQTMFLDGPAARAVLMPIMRQSFEMASPDDKEMIEDALAGLVGTIETEVRIVTDPATLRPVWVETRKTTEMRVAGFGIDDTQVEEHTYSFEWSPIR
jgi:hypothetical protein